MQSTQILTDDLLIRLLQEKFKQDEILNALQDAGLEVKNLRIDLLTIALDALGLPPEDVGPDSDRDWMWGLWLETVETGSCEEIQDFFAAVRAGAKADEQKNAPENWI